MSQEIEIEYKNLLTREEFNRILTHLPFTEQGKTQINYYFETTQFSLKKNGCALRIREKYDKYNLTLKEPHPEGLLETHDTLTKQEALDWIQGKIVAKKHTTKQLTAMNISPMDLIYYGTLTTVRRELEYGNVLVVLDYSTYNGEADYELEIEAPSEAIGIQTFDDLLRQFQIPKRDTPNKIKRFFQSAQT